MPDNDFWIGQEQIPVDLSLLLTYHNSESAVNMMNMVMDAHMPKDFFDGFVCGDEEYGLNEEAHEMASGRKEIDTQTETKDAPEVDADKEVK